MMLSIMPMPMPIPGLRLDLVDCVELGTEESVRVIIAAVWSSVENQDQVGEPDILGTDGRKAATVSGFM